MKYRANSESFSALCLDFETQMRLILKMDEVKHIRFNVFQIQFEINAL